MWKLDDDSWKLVLSYHHVGPSSETQVIRLGSKCLRWLSYLVHPAFFLYCFFFAWGDGKSGDNPQTDHTSNTKQKVQGAEALL